MAKIKPVTIGQMEKLGVDENNKLYWNGIPVVIDKTIKLQWLVNVSIFIGAISAFASAMIALFQFMGYGS